MFRLIAAASIRIRFFLRCYMPTNILADAIRTRRGHKWGPAAMLLAGPYFLLAVWFVHLIDTGGPGWLHLLVLLAIWNGFKMLWLGPLGIAWLLKGAGLLLGVATGKSRRGLVATLDQHGLLDRFAVRLRLGGRLLCRSGLGLLAQPAEQAFLLAGLGRRLLVVVGTKHGEGILKDAKRRQPGCRPQNGSYPSTSPSRCAKRGTATEPAVRIPRLCLTRAGHYHGCRVAALPSTVAGTNLDESRLCL